MILPTATRVACNASAATSTILATRTAIMPVAFSASGPCDVRYLNSAIASSASTPPVISIGANGALAARSALEIMI